MCQWKFKFVLLLNLLLLYPTTKTSTNFDGFPDGIQCICCFFRRGTALGWGSSQVRGVVHEVLVHVAQTVHLKTKHKILIETVS